MKKIFFAAAILFAALFTAKADNNERPVTLDKLPAPAQEFLKANFSDLTFAYAVEEVGFFGNEYEVYYTDRTQVEFDSKGEWTKIERAYEALPESLVPVKIMDFIKQHQPQAKVKSMDRDKRDIEVELTSGVELKFDLQYNLVGYDD